MVSGKEKYQGFPHGTILRNVKHVTVTIPMYCFIVQRIYNVPEICRTLFLLVEKEMATHSSTLAWKIPWTEEPCRLQSMGSQRVRHD